jgi:putative component of membrane protein insertase Oxa1/YidC/SpoIIIJ protein YidD
LAKRLALLAIALYQRHLSPRKGYGCAYRLCTGRRGCSAFGARAIRVHGVRGGVALLRERMALCASAAASRHRAPLAAVRAQRGSCDAPCDVPDCGACDGADHCDCSGCDWPRSNKDRHPTPAERADARRRRRKERRERAPP